MPSDNLYGPARRHALERRPALQRLPCRDRRGEPAPESRRALRRPGAADPDRARRAPCAAGRRERLSHRRRGGNARGDAAGADVPLALLLSRGRRGRVDADLLRPADGRGCRDGGAADDHEPEERRRLLQRRRACDLDGRGGAERLSAERRGAAAKRALVRRQPRLRVRLSLRPRQLQPVPPALRRLPPRARRAARDRPRAEAVRRAGRSAVCRPRLCRARSGRRLRRADDL